MLARCRVCVFFIKVANLFTVACAVLLSLQTNVRDVFESATKEALKNKGGKKKKGCALL